MSMQEIKPNRKRFTADQKFKVVKEHLTTKTPVSELCKKYGMTPNSFYTWQDHFFSAAFQGLSEKKRGPQNNSRKEDEKIKELETDISRMQGVIAEITAENIAFKKKNLVLYR